MEHYKTRRDTKTKKEIKEPDKYAVILLNDHYTTISFVEKVLETIFHKNSFEAKKITMQVHCEGKGIAGIYPFDIAETKAQEVKSDAEKNDFPLLAVVEPA